ncbi:MAG: DUF2971 domain-containing protein, partial [Paludibacteraceae bacterium]|nr:DUF2971 domain-containing protein [Paludibacteraceae bacterium]
HYCYNHRGICIGLDLDKVMACVPPMFGTMYLKHLVFDVQYQDIIERPNAYYSKEAQWGYQWCTKAKEWEYEQEVRLVMPKPSAMYAAFTPSQAEEAKKDKHKIWDWKEIHHYLPLKGDCYDCIYFGVKIDPNEKEKIINYVRKKLNPDTKFYQMQVDENAFRLKAEPIID